MENFTENALKILRARYFRKNSEGELTENKPSDLFRRVSKYIAKAEKDEAARKHWEQEFFNAMMSRDFMPNSPTLTGADRGMCLSACFVLPIEDSLEKIFETVKNAALVHKEGGGTGFDFDDKLIYYLLSKGYPAINIIRFIDEPYGHRLVISLICFSSENCIIPFYNNAYNEIIKVLGTEIVMYDPSKNSFYYRPYYDCYDES